MRLRIVTCNMHYALEDSEPLERFLADQDRR